MVRTVMLTFGAMILKMASPKCILKMGLEYFFLIIIQKRLGLILFNDDKRLYIFGGSSNLLQERNDLWFS